MILRAATTAEVVRELGAFRGRSLRVSGFDLSSMNRILGHVPEDMTVSVEAGLCLGALQRQLRTRGQWLPIDPPNAEALTVGALLADNRSGPRRLGYGTIRDHLIGLTVALSDGRVIHSGGKVVKNVAGFDLLKLFVGSRGSLGVILEATFKLLPVPECEVFVARTGLDFEESITLIEKVTRSELTPTVMDLHQGPSPVKCRASLVLGFAGFREDVDYQLERATALGMTPPATLDHDAVFWNSDRTSTPQRRSVLPSSLCATLRDLAPASYVARAGNGVIYHRGGRAPAGTQVPSRLGSEVKRIFDPAGALPEWTEEA